LLLIYVIDAIFSYLDNMTRGKTYILQLYNTYYQTNLKHPVSCLQCESNRQNKHVLRASRGKGAPQNPVTRQFILFARY